MRKKTFRDRANDGVLYRGQKSSSSALSVNGKGSSAAAADVGFKKRPIFHHLTRLHHGILRYRNIADSPTSVTQAEVLNQHRKFVYFPAGYATQNDKCLQETLLALDLKKLPPLVIVTASTDGAVEEHLDDDTGISLGNPLKLDPPKDLDLTEDEERELLHEKTHEILKSTVECCGEMGAWLLPHRPRRANGAAEVLCNAVPRESTKPPVILGLIGLDKHDQEDGFADLIVSNVYPVGCEVEKVAEVTYDPNIRDNTPCPELTHLLIFQRRREMREFREKLLSQVPELFLAYGNSTSYAKNCMFASVVNNSPVALITHTSKPIDDMALALRHADREITKVNVGAKDPPPLGTASHEVSGARATFETFPLPPLHELEHDNDLSRFLTIWPASHDDERIVLADPRRVGGVTFQQQMVMAIKAAFYTRQARAKVLQEAATLLQSLKNSSEARNDITEAYHLKMVLAILSAVVAAVLYAKVYGADPAPSLQNRNPYQIGLFLTTIAIPFVIVSLKKSYDHHSQTWSAVQGNAAKLESVIFEFRARPRTFGQSTNADPLEAFIETVRTIRSRNQTLMDPNETIASLESITNDNAVSEGNAQEVLPEEHDDENGYDVEAPPPSEASPLLPANLTLSPLKDIHTLSANWKKYSSAEQAGNAADFHDYQEYTRNSEVITGEDEDIKNRTTLADDWSSPLTIKDYIIHRIQATKDEKTQELQTLKHRNEIMDTIIKVVLGSTSLFALASKQWFIPIVLGMSAAFASSQDFRKYSKRVDQGEAMIGQVDELRSWWNRLAVDEKILSSNQDRLVQQAENIILADTSFTY